MRHHIVHRNGKYEESHLLSIDSESVSEVAEGILEFPERLTRRFVTDMFLIMNMMAIIKRVENIFTINRKCDYTTM